MAQDVADDVCESWEEMIENGILEKKLEELQLKLPRINSGEERSVEDPRLWPQMKLEDPSRTPYAPQVKILKRDKSIAGGGTVVADKSPSRHPPKTLKQREAEYAQARLRILGSARSAEEEQSASNSGAVPSLNERTGAEVVVTRLPRGPDGTNGFARPR